MRGCFLILFLVLSGCAAEAPEADAKIPGKLLGTFATTGRIATDECGADLLGAADPWRFDVKLSRFEHDLYWLNGREAIVGDLASDGEAFDFSTRIEVPLTPGRPSAAGCIVERRDTASGVLKLEGEEVSGFEGTLAYEYRAKTSSDCIEFIGVTGGVNALPCTLSYDLTAVNVSAPAEE